MESQNEDENQKYRNLSEILESGSAGGNGKKPAGDMAEPNTISPFSKGEEVLAQRPTGIFEANVEKVERMGEDWLYFIHYKGLAKRFDKWLHGDKLMKCTDKNTGVYKNTRSKKLLESTRILDQTDTEAGVYKNTRSKKLKVSHDTKVDKAEGTDNVDKGEKQTINLGIEIQIPLILKKQLVSDWKFITQQNKLVKLPRSPSVHDILEQYEEYISTNYDMIEEAIGEILKGITCYFDIALPMVLLYPNERQQYLDAISDDVTPSSIYGAEHLMRLFVKLPEFEFEFVNSVGVEFQRMQQRLLNFLRFLQDNKATFFVSAYDGP